MQSWIQQVVKLSVWWWTFVVPSTLVPGVLLCDLVQLMEVQVLDDHLEKEV